MNDTQIQFTELLSLVSKLRSDRGCPWDKKQTPQSLKSYLMEETLETIAAIDEDNPDHVREELGDLLFLTVLICHLYQERNLFSIEEVITGITEKMIRRHPHVFSNTPAGSEQDLRKRWLAIKASEKKMRRQVKI